MQQSTCSSFEYVWKALDNTGAPLLWAWRQEAAKIKPYKGLKIYHNTPLSVETICKVEALCAAGAEVVVSANDFLIPATFSEARESVDAMGLEYRENKYAEEGEFDFYLDCCAELSPLPPPTCGVIELTRTGAITYQNKHFASPILSVDNSYLKALETFYGTGESFLRAFRELSCKNPLTETFAIIGYGKVGRGVVHGIRKHGGKCIIFDTDPIAREKAISHGLQAYSCGDDKNALRVLNDVTVVVTATGYSDILKKTFPEAEQRLAGKTLCNIGASDEIGRGFKDSEVLAEGQCINFTLRHPTLMRYLDPSFYAHNLGIQLLKDHQYEQGFHPFPKELDISIINRWSEIHNEPNIAHEMFQDDF